MPVSKVTIPREVIAAFQRHQREEIDRERTHGDVRGPISIDFKGHRIVAAGSKLLWSESWKVFPDFLSQYLHNLLGKEWGSHQVSLPFVQQHPVVQWRTIFTTACQSQARDKNGLFNATTGAASAWFRLAYDLYLIEHNSKLQKKLVRRLRESVSFQGARFEAAIAAMMLAAGYDLQFADERGPGKHPEFFATNRNTGHRLAVEAKSRHRPGILGFGGQKEVQEPQAFDIGGLLRAALAKNPVDPLLIFIELNSPKLATDLTGADFHADLSEVWNQALTREWPNGFPAIGVVFYNDASPWFIDSQSPMGDTPVFVLTMWTDHSRHQFDPLPLLNRIMEGCGQRLNIPHEFPKDRRETDGPVP